VIQRAHMRTTLTHTSQLRRGGGLLLAPTTSALELCNSPSTPSPKDGSFAWQGAEDDASHWRAWLTRCLLLQPEEWQASTDIFTAVRLHRHPECHRVLHADVSIERHLSRIFPAHPRSLASVLVPRHITPSRKERGPRPRFCGTARLCFFGFQKIFSAELQERRKKRFSEPSENASLGLGSGAPSRRFAQECPEGNPGKSKQEKFQWHSIPTKSS
jgi:hypothetical protein